MDVYQVGCGIAFGLAFLFGPCIAWPEYVEADDVGPLDIRRVMLVVFVLCTTLELALVVSGDLAVWSLGLVLMSNVWGMLDAFLRFPVVQPLLSFFTGKQALLVLLKTWCYISGFHNASERLGLFVIVLLGLVFLMPLLYITALPIDDPVTQAAKHDVVDVDIAVRFFRTVYNPAARAQAAAAWRCKRHRAVVQVVHKLPYTRKMALSLFPVLHPHLRPGPCV